MPDVVSNTGPLIALASIGQFDLLRRLFGKILIPPAVRAEVQDETSVAALSPIHSDIVVDYCHVASSSHSSTVHSRRD